MNIEKEYIVVTIHRAENTEDRERLINIMEALNFLSKKYKLIFPIHPRTSKYISLYKIKLSDNLLLIPPVSYDEMLSLIKGARLVITDSGGVQKEAFYLGVPSVIVTHCTEWIELVQAGFNVLAGWKKDRIIYEVEKLWRKKKNLIIKNPYGEGNASNKIVEILLKHFKIKV